VSSLLGCAWPRFHSALACFVVLVVVVVVLLLFVARGVGPLVKTTRAQESRSRIAVAVEEAPAQKA
jgi:hypothetical protein